jgi:quercetin dioxygenase-like cupin family protein
MADKTGLSESFLSQFERGITQASIASLRAITESLGIELGDLFDTSRASSARVLRKGDRPELPFGNNALKHLLTPRRLENIESFVVDFAVDGSTGPDKYTHGDSEELIVVQRGVIRLEVASEVFLLEEGDSIVFRSSAPHRVVNIHSAPSSVHWVISPPSH